MAYPEAPTGGREFLYGIAIQPSYGTAVTDAVAVCRLRGLDSVSIDEGIKQYEHKVGTTKDPMIEESLMDVSGSAAKITLSGQLNRLLLPIWSNVHFQYVTGNVYSYFSDHPLTPYSITFIVHDPVSGRSKVYEGCVSPTFGYSAERGDDDLVKFDITLQSRKAGLIDQTLTGVNDPANWQTSGSKADGYGKFHHTDLTYKIDVGAGDVAVLPSSWAMTFAHDELEQDDTDGAGAYNEIGFSERSGCTFEFNAKPSTNLHTALTRARNGGAFKFKTLGFMKSFAIGQIMSAELDPDGLTSYNVTAAIKTPDKDSNMVEIDCS